MSDEPEDEQPEDDEQELIDKLGSGMAFPPQPADGGLKMAEGIEHLKGGMTALVLTQKGSHAYSPGFGWPIKELIPTGDTKQINQAIKEAFKRSEDRIDHSNLEVSAGSLADGFLPVEITYTLAGGSKRRHLTVNVPWPPKN